MEEEEGGGDRRGRGGLEKAVHDELSSGCGTLPGPRREGDELPVNTAMEHPGSLVSRSSRGESVLGESVLGVLRGAHGLDLLPLGPAWSVAGG